MPPIPSDPSDPSRDPYTLVTYRKLFPDRPGQPPSNRWYIYYTVPGEPMQRAIYADAADLTDAQAHQAIQADLDYRRLAKL